MLGALCISIFAAQLLAILRGVAGQTSSVQCLSTWTWSYNSRQQSPCLTAAYLEATCNAGQYNINPLDVGTHYIGPYAATANPCQCSTVTYSLVSACGACQNRTFETWSSWQTNCSTVYPQVFPETIPSGTAVPHWAYLDVVTSDTFDAAAASAAGDGPESTASAAKQTGSALTSQSASASVTGGSNSGASPTAGSSAKKSSNAGAIAGGVVGGVVGLGLVAGLVAFLIRRRRNRVAPSSEYGAVHTAPHTPMSPPPMSQYSEYGPTGSPFATSQATDPLSQPKLYDPSDPSTFPTSAPSPTLRTTSSGFDGSVGYNPHGVQPPLRGQYSGAPEL